MMPLEAYFDILTNSWFEFPSERPALANVDKLCLERERLSSVVQFQAYCMQVQNDHILLNN